MQDKTILLLPDDILNSIFSHLNQATTLVTMLVSRKFHDVGLKRLYRSIYYRGDRWPPLSLKAEADIPFHQNYTIINKKQQLDKLLLSKHMDSVKYVLCKSEDQEFRSSVFGKWPWIKVDLEQCYWKDESVGYMDVVVTDFIKELPVTNLAPLEQDNYTLKSLIVIVDEMLSTEVLEMVPRMKALERIKLVGSSEYAFDCFKFTPNTPLKIKGLCLCFIGIDVVDYSRILRLFDMSVITSFESKLHWLYSNVDHQNQLTWLMFNLPNLKNLAFETCRFMSFANVMKPLQKHTLEKLYITCHQLPPLRETQFHYCMEDHAKTLTHFFLSNTDQRLWTFEEFQRIYERGTSKDKVKEVEIIDKFLSSDVSYPNLRYIVIDRDWYVIDRTKNGFKVVPMN